MRAALLLALLAAPASAACQAGAFSFGWETGTYRAATSRPAPFLGGSAGLPDWPAPGATCGQPVASP